MHTLKEEAKMDLAGLFREIMQNNPPLTHFNLKRYGGPDEYNGSSV